MYLEKTCSISFLDVSSLVCCAFLAFFPIFIFFYSSKIFNLCILYNLNINTINIYCNKRNLKGRRICSGCNMVSFLYVSLYFIQANKFDYNIIAWMVICHAMVVSFLGIKQKVKNITIIVNTF